MKTKIKFILLLTSVFFFVSCSSQLEITALEDCSSHLDFKLELGSVITQTIESITQGLTEIENASANVAVKETGIFSKELIENAFKVSDFKNINVKIPEKDKLNLSLDFPSPANQKVTTDKGNFKAANFITCTKNSLTLILSPEILKELANSFNEESRTYLDLLMSPVFSDDASVFSDEEQMTASEYIDLVEVVYGEKLAKELEKATVKISLIPPKGKTITKTALSETGQSKLSSNKAVFTLPLADLLTLNSTKTFSISF